jgi:hypothetical protein
MKFTQREINEKLESLVGNRFTAEKLNKHLSQMFGVDVEISEHVREECTQLEIPDLDYQLLFSIGDFIDVDLYYLRDNGGNYYITETNFEYI